MHALGAAPQRVAQGFGRVQHVGLPHQRRDLAVQALQRLGYLLHVVAFTVRRLVAIDVVHADAVGGCRQRTRHRLQAARTDRRDHGAGLAVHPGQRRAGMRHLHFVAEIEDLRDAGLGVHAQHLGQVGGAMAEDPEVLGDALPQQAQHQALGQRHAGMRGQQPLFQRSGQAARPRDSGGAHLLARQAGQFGQRHLGNSVHAVSLDAQDGRLAVIDFVSSTRPCPWPSTAVGRRRRWWCRNRRRAGTPARSRASRPGP